MDIETQLKNMEVISQQDVFRILSALIKRQAEDTSFTWLKVKLNLNPNSLSKYLKKLIAFGLVDNYYKKQKDGKHFSFYCINKKGLNILNLQIGFPRIWELLSQFKEQCKSKGWRTPEFGEWIETDGKYHNFIWTRIIHPSTFKKVVSSPRAAIREGNRYKIVDVAYTAWLFPETPPNELYQILTEEPKIAETTAIYDLSQAYLIGPNVIKLNKTDSEVFREFEYFLQTRWKLEFTDVEFHLEESTK